MTWVKGQGGNHRHVVGYLQGFGQPLRGGLTTRPDEMQTELRTQRFGSGGARAMRNTVPPVQLGDLVDPKIAV